MVYIRHLLSVVAVAGTLHFPSLAFASEGQTAAVGSAIVQTIFVLIGVCALAVLALRFGARRLGAAPDAPMRVIARLPLEPRRALLVVKVADRTMLLASSEAGVHPVGELSAAEAAVFWPEPTFVSRETSEVMA